MFAGTNYTIVTLATSWQNSGDTNRYVGQQNLFDNTSNNFYLTGVQLEVGNSASDFEHRSFGEELSLCQRYFSKITSIDVSTYYATGGSAPTENFTYQQTMRAAPTCTLTRQAGDSYNLASINQRNITADSFNLYVVATSGNNTCAFGHNGNPATYTMEAEL